MNSFTAQIIYRINCEGVATEQYEEQWRIIFATDERNAIEEAKRTGKEEECNFSDRHGRRIEWKMIAIKEIKKIDISHGALLFSMLKEVEPIAAPTWAVS